MRSLLVAAVAAASLVLAACGQEADPEKRLVAANFETQVEDTTGCGIPLSFDPNSPAFMTTDISGGILTDQAAVDCYAWQMFIALNWPVDSGWPATASQAGVPNRSASASSWGVSIQGQPTPTTVWQSYKGADETFLPGGAAPSGWGEVAALPAQCTSDNRLLAGVAASPAMPMLSQISKAPKRLSQNELLASAADTGFSSSINEAFGGWLTDQKGKLAYFDRRMGKAEFDYIVSNQLYLAANQAKVATSADAGISLPKGAAFRGTPSLPLATQDQLGAIEVKIAWRDLTTEQDLWNRYLTSSVYLQDPDTGQCRQAVVGMVGMHIIHKTDHFPDFVWSTFEHVDNVPDPSRPAPAGGYSFNDGKGTTPSNQPRVKCDSAGNCKPLFPMSEPVQVTRQFPIPTEVATLNAAVQKMIGEMTGGSSVFQYYELVNVLWDQAPNPPSPEPGKGATSPLSYGSFISAGPNTVVANTTLETYIQGTNCTGCHKFAKIASTTSDQDQLAADFSFLFGSAH
ncbi:hypothetical protein [Parerythrobacter aestuarii]|uniref:hypothetical protein n=1 Tax=Parerythrobacter aestuarii TaxID=3020909 RepID=UPI0024DE7D73|nr:hypothetical protein [Parerythrobacter aestuarii]